MPLPPRFLEHLQRSGYHPRSNKHSDALAQAIVDDLIEYCHTISDRAAAGKLVYQLNFDLISGSSQWNVDLVLGAPPPGTLPPEDQIIRRTDPSTVQIAIEIKSVMTEHRKAVKNRKRDLAVHHEHVHYCDQNAIAGGVLVVNASERFRSPLRSEVTNHHQPAALLAHCVNEMRNVSIRGGPSMYGLDARTAFAVDMDNIDLSNTRYVLAAPAPQVGDPMHYDAFIQRICSEFTSRFGR